VWSLCGFVDESMEWAKEFEIQNKTKFDEVMLQISQLKKKKKTLYILIIIIIIMIIKEGMGAYSQEVQGI
jgi:hypothetical protein